MASQRILCGSIYVALAFGLLVSVASATQPVVHSKSLAANTNNKKATPVTVDRDAEARATQLVRSHLPNLKEILRRLRENEPGEYAKAIRDLARSARKLEVAENRADGSFDLELELLKSQTEVNLLTARLQVRDSTRDRKQLRVAAERLQAAQISKAKHDVQVLRDRLNRAQKQLELAQQRLQTRQANPEGQLEKSYTNLLRKAGRALAEPSETKPNRNDRKDRSPNSKNKTTDGPNG